MTNFPEEIYLHDGKDGITWSEHEEVDGVKYVKCHSNDCDWCGTPEQEIESLRELLEKQHYEKDQILKIALFWQEAGVQPGSKELVGEIREVLGVDDEQ